MALTNGPALLLSEIKRRGITRAQAADELDVSPVTIHFWIKETHRPTGARPELIEAWSGGRVPRTAWQTPEEKAALRQAQRVARAVGS